MEVKRSFFGFQDAPVLDKSRIAIVPGIEAVLDWWADPALVGKVIIL